MGNTYSSSPWPDSYFCEWITFLPETRKGSRRTLQGSSIYYRDVKWQAPLRRNLSISSCRLLISLTVSLLYTVSRGSQDPEYASDLFEQKTSFGQTHQTGNGSSPPLKSTTRQWSERKWMNGSMYIPFQIQIKGRNDKRRVREIRSFPYIKLSKKRPATLIQVL